MSWWRRFDGWWKRDAGTFSNGFVLLAAWGWVFTFWWTMHWLIGVLL